MIASVFTGEPCFLTFIFQVSSIRYPATTDISIIIIDCPLSMIRSGLINEVGVSMNGSIEILGVFHSDVMLPYISEKCD